MTDETACFEWWLQSITHEEKSSLLKVLLRGVCRGRAQGVQMALGGVLAVAVALVALGINLSIHKVRDGSGT